MKYLYEALRNEVLTNGDDILSDAGTVARIVVYYSDLNLPPDTMLALGKAIQNNYVDRLHRHYVWDQQTIDSAYEFADIHNISHEIMFYLAEAFAFAIELIGDVEHKTPVKQVKPKKRHKLTIEEIERLIEVEHFVDKFFVLSRTPRFDDGKLILSIFVTGTFTESFRGGVFNVKYYGKNGFCKHNWYRTTIHSVPLCCSNKKIKGTIEMTLDPIWSNHEVTKINLSFQNSENYTDITHYDTWWCSYDGEDESKE